MPDNIINTIIKFNSLTVGRDRLFRLMQYGSRLIWWVMEKYSHDKDIVNRLKNLEYSLSTGRKLFRLGRSLDSLYSALNTINLPDLTLRLTLTLSRINFALYLLTDHIIWIGRVGLKEINKLKWSNISYRLWLYSLVMNLMRDIYEILNILQLQPRRSSTLGQQCHIKQKPFQLLAAKGSTLFQWMVQHKDVTLDTIKNGCDVWLPLTLLGYVKISPGLVGLLGVISSIAGIIPIVDPSCKLLPG